ncbi:MAG: phage tail sheath family protein [Chitinophagaceae bacterium]|nr:phage tail sheath family protein [Chitinophagaceae bacterium]
MPTTLKTPGVYIDEINAFPGSAVAVETAVPVFIGYTETAVRNGKSLVGKPTRITSFAEYTETFGGAFLSKFEIIDATDPQAKGTFTLNNTKKIVSIKSRNTSYFYNCIRLFYANGGGTCYILSVKEYGATPDGFDIKQSDFTDVFDALEKEFEPTLIVIPDLIALGKDIYNDTYGKVLAHCAKMKSRMGIFDLRRQTLTDTTDAVVDEFRFSIGTNYLNYGTAYYPWLKTSIVQPDEVNFLNLDSSVDLETLLPSATEAAAISIVKKLKADQLADSTPASPPDSPASPPTGKKLDKAAITNYHNSLRTASPTYTHLLEEIRSILNELPPAAAMAGVYTLVDNSRGVWKAPANVSLSMVNEPSINISSLAQENLNVDVMAGKSINVIRPFPGIGTLVWGARTLDGNSQDWKYINVRRTLIMIEQSLKLATRAYVFEPNDAGTWVTVKSMFNNFLSNLWKQGALAGAVPEQAFDVQIGLGATMTPNDILDGIMKITVKVAVVRPAEFILITFQQQQQLS